MRNQLGRLLALCLLAHAWQLAPAAAAPRRVRIPVWIQQKHGLPALRPADFRVTIEGAASNVRQVRTFDSDLIVIIVLDLVSELTLDSMAKEALQTSIESLPRRAHVAVVRAQDGLKVLVDPTTDRKATTDAILSVPISGTPGLLDTVEVSGRIADAALKEDVRVAVMYVTDGDVNGYREDFRNAVVNSSDSHDLSRKFPEALIQEKISRLEASVARQQAPLFITHLKYRTDRSNEAYQNGLKVLAEATGGVTTFCRSNAEIADAIKKTLDTICSHHSLTVEIPADVPQLARVQVSIAPPAGAGRTVSHRPRLVLGEVF